MAGIGRVHAHGVGQPLDISDSRLRPRFQLLQRVGAIGMDGNCRRENVGIFIRKLDHVVVGHVHVGLAEIDGAVGVVMFIEAEDAVFSVVFQRADETRQPFDILAIGIVDVFDAGGAGIDLKFQPFEI